MDVFIVHTVIKSNESLATVFTPLNLSVRDPSAKNVQIIAVAKEFTCRPQKMRHYAFALQELITGGAYYLSLFMMARMVSTTMLPQEILKIAVSLAPRD